MSAEDPLPAADAVAMTVRRRLADAARRSRTVQRLELRLRHGMRTADAVRVLDALARVGVEAHVAGGWGVDALVGRQTRRHRDLDLVVSDAQLDRALDALAAMGFALRADQVVPEARLPRSLTCISRSGRRVDLHPFAGAPAGTGNGPVGAAAFAVARGAIAGRAVSCLSAETQLAFHEGYVRRMVDVHDLELVRRLAPAGGR